MLQLNNIEVIFNEVILVLKGVSLNVPDGEIICLLGANGAGKTTTLKAVSGLLKEENGKITDGEAFFNNQRIDQLSADRIVKSGIFQVMEGRRVFAHLTVEENLRVGAFSRKNLRSIGDDLEEVYTYFPKLKTLRQRTAGYLSGGEQQMLAIGRALMARPKLMLLDEPSLGLAPMLVEEIFEIVKRINREQKVGVLLVEQNAMAALEIASFGYVMENGRIVMDGAAEELRSNPDVKEFYLGLTEFGEKRGYKKIKHYKRRKRWLS